MKKSELDLPAGFRFHPTDEELVNHYLIKKCASQPIAVSIIAEVDLYKFDPWKLPELAVYGEKEWYFFSPRDRKYPNGSRPNRAAGTGYWKATGADKPIGQPKPLGIKKALVFYAGKAPKGVKTNWIMHEYRLANVDRSAGKKNNLRLDDWVLCRLYNKKGRIEKHLLAEQKPVEFPKTIEYPEMEEDKKPSVWMLNQNQFALPQQQQQLQPKPMHSTLTNDLSHMESTDSAPKLHPESSCSEHVLSPDFTLDKEVQSQPKWNELYKDLDFQFNSLAGLMDDPFASQIHYQANQISPWQDMFYYAQKPF